MRKGFSVVIILSLLALLLLGGALVAAWWSGQAEPTNPPLVSREAAGSVGAVTAESAIDNAAAGRYLPYSEAALTAASGKIVLFFHAPWCPTCRAAEADILARTAAIPADLTILKVDYDTAEELKRRYGIPYQHTFVEVDGRGNELQKWSGGELDEIVERVS